MGEITDSLTATAPAPSSRSLPFREDCWSEEATATLVDAWGRRFMELNRGNLRHKDWQDVADAVNELHGHTKKGRRTDVQCKNRIDTLKKKYKAEKAKIVESDGTLAASTWPFFSRLDVLIGNSGKQQFPNVSSVMAASASTLPLPSPSPSPLLLSLPSPPIAVPLAYRWPTPAVPQPVVLPQKRPSPSMDNSYFRRNYSAVAAAAAAAAATEDKDANEEDGREESEEEMEASEGTKEEDGIRRLAKAIERFGAIYERVEGMKRRQMIELEKQRMEFAKDLELQRMQLFMDTQVQLEKIKQAKRPASDDIYS